MRSFRNVLCGAMVACAALVFGAGPASAQGPGVRAGVSVDPDQFYVGGHFETDELIDHLYLRPNLEVGFGDDVTTVAVNIEAVYKFPLKNRRDTNFYAGGGPAINIYDRDNGSDAKGGLNLLGGIEFGKVFVEVKGGVFDSPNLKIGIGYTFR
ncbi:MAG: hypothetical protein JJE40_12335 [Vicinamibacteria bacterium]|nr:hypothetical protein [Vicinamibacteria bacterium]